MTDAEFLALVQAKFPHNVRIGDVTGQVRLKAAAWDFLREHCWIRDGKRCFNCQVPVTIDKGYWSSVQLAHRKSKGSGGSDAPSNCRSLCIRCHSAEHAGKKVS